MTASVFLQSEDLLPEALNVSFELVPAVMAVGMSALLLTIGYVSRVADIEGMWVTGRSIGNIENGMVIGANWMFVASHPRLAEFVVFSGFYGLVFIIGWTAGYFVLFTFLATQMRWFEKHTAPDFVDDRFNSDTVWVVGALMTILIGFIYSVGQAREMGLVGLYVLGVDYVTMVTVMMAIMVDHLTISGITGAVKSMAVQCVIFVIAFLTAVYVVGFVDGYSTILSYIEYG